MFEMPPDLRQEVRPRRGYPQPLQHQARWLGVGLDGYRQLPVPPLLPPQWLAAPLAAPWREIERADWPRPKAAKPGWDLQQDDWPAKEQRGSWKGCDSLRDLATVELRLRPHGHRLHLHRHRRRHRDRHRAQKRRLPRGTPLSRSQRVVLWIFSRFHLFYLL